MKKISLIFKIPLLMIAVLTFCTQTSCSLLSNAELVKIEKDFWDSCPSRDPAKQVAEAIVTPIFQPNVAAPAQADLTNMPKYQIVQHLDIVQSKKHQARRETNKRQPAVKIQVNAGSRVVSGQEVNYITGYNSSANNVDPAAENISYNNRNFSFSMNYNGYKYTQQPGNFYFTEQGKSALVYDTLPAGLTLQSPDAELLLLGEVSRRHAWDQIRKIPDEFCELPVGLALAMANSLISKGYITLNDFWKNNGKYHVYSRTKTERTRNLQNLYALYANKIMSNIPLPAGNLNNPDHEDLRKKHLSVLMDNYFQVPVDNIGDNFSGQNIFQ